MADLKQEYRRCREDAIIILVDALAKTFEEVTGKKPSPKVLEEIYQAVRFSDG